MRFLLALFIATFTMTSFSFAQSTGEQSVKETLKEIYMRGSVDGNSVYWVLPLSSLKDEYAKDISSPVSDMLRPFKPGGLKAITAETVDLAIDFFDVYRVTDDIKGYWQDANLQLQDENNRAVGSEKVRFTLAVVNGIKYVVFDIPFNTVRTLTRLIVPTVKVPVFVLTMAAGPGAHVVMGVLGGASYLLRASYSLISTTTLATVYLATEGIQRIKYGSAISCQKIF